MSLFLRTYGDTDFVTGLRAIAAMMVVAIHTGALRDFGALGDIITDNGKYGVQIFFVISGFTIARTFGNAVSFKSYFGRRMMRIAPLYFVLILFTFYLTVAGIRAPIYWMTLYDNRPDAYNLLMHLTFLSAWDARVANSLIGVEWSIPIEVFWYAVLPMVLPIVATPRHRLLIVIAFLALAGLTKAAEHAVLPAHAAHFLPLSYGAYFYLGALAETWRRQAPDLPDQKRRTVYYASVGLFIVALCTDTGLNAAFFGLATVGIIATRTGTARGFLALPPLIFLGSISYSIYLVHPLILSFLRTQTDLTSGSALAFFAITLGLTTIISMITYALIEIPTNRLGARLFGTMAGHKPS